MGIALPKRNNTRSFRRDSVCVRGKGFMFWCLMLETQCGHASTLPSCANDKCFVSGLFKRRPFSFHHCQRSARHITSISEQSLSILFSLLVCCCVFHLYLATVICFMCVTQKQEQFVSQLPPLSPTLLTVQWKRTKSLFSRKCHPNEECHYPSSWRYGPIPICEKITKSGTWWPKALSTSKWLSQKACVFCQVCLLDSSDHQVRQRSGQDLFPLSDWPSRSFLFILPVWLGSTLRFWPMVSLFIIQTASAIIRTTHSLLTRSNCKKTVYNNTRKSF